MPGFHDDPPLREVETKAIVFLFEEECLLSEGCSVVYDDERLSVLVPQVHYCDSLVP